MVEKIKSSKRYSENEGCCVFVFNSSKRHNSSTYSEAVDKKHFSQSAVTTVHKLSLLVHNGRFQEMVFPRRKSAYSFLRSTRCILKVLGEVFEKAIMCLRSSLNAPSATSCTLIGPMLPFIRKDL